MKQTGQMASPLGVLLSAASLDGVVSRYRNKQNIYSQGEPADALFYIEKGAVRLASRTGHQKSVVTTVLGVTDIFGALCLAGYTHRTSTAVALCDSSIRVLKKEKILDALRKGKNRLSNCLMVHLLSSIKHYQDHVADLLTAHAEQRLALVLLQLARMDKNGPAVVEIPLVSHQVLAEMVGTTRPRVNFFMNQFRLQGFLSYDKKLEIHRSLLKVVRGIKNHTQSHECPPEIVNSRTSH
ncbi:MAG: Crp/Fnr family transcriptional regulator [Candidatus Acidiferrum sp.]|jgi:CRP/FNR family cyclic AMP-dependent transcriptional regulator